MDLKVNVCAVPQEYAILRKLHSIEQKLEEQNMQQKVLLNSREASIYLGISLQHLYRMTGRRELPHYNALGKNFFNRNELDEWLQRNRRATKEEVRKVVKVYKKQKGRAGK